MAISTPLGTQTVQYEFTALADAQQGLRGVARQGLETTELSELQVTGREVTWVQRVTRPMTLTLKFTVIVDGDQLGGTARAGALPASKVSGTRVAIPR